MVEQAIQMALLPTTIIISQDADCFWYAGGGKIKVSERKGDDRYNTTEGVGGEICPKVASLQSFPRPSGNI
jgi:hypothetical protein